MALLQTETPEGTHGVESKQTQLGFVSKVMGRSLLVPLVTALAYLFRATSFQKKATLIFPSCCLLPVLSQLLRLNKISRRCVNNGLFHADSHQKFYLVSSSNGRRVGANSNFATSMTDTTVQEKVGFRLQVHLVSQSTANMTEQSVQKRGVRGTGRNFQGSSCERAIASSLHS